MFHTEYKSNKIKLIKWKCNICNTINSTEPDGQYIKILDNNIFGLGDCIGVCSIKKYIKTCATHLPEVSETESDSEDTYQNNRKKYFNSDSEDYKLFNK